MVGTLRFAQPTVLSGNPNDFNGIFTRETSHAISIEHCSFSGYK
jgi:hypothetical protein